jgi:ribosome-associated protein
MLKISRQIIIPENEIERHAVASQGSGGQNVNKVASAIHLRFDIRASSLPDSVKERLLNLNDQRITQEGIVVIKSQQYRTQERNRDEALKRLRTLIQSAMATQRRRKPTKPTKTSKEKRLKEKTRRGQIKSLRGKVND